MKRDLVGEIFRKRGTSLRRGTRLSKAQRRLDTIVAAFDYLEQQRHSPDRQELLRYIPIALIACIEGYFRLAIQELVDSGSPYCERITELSDTVLSKEHVVAIHLRRVSLGEIISHTVKISQFGDITKAMSSLFGCDFLAALKRAQFSASEDGTPVTFDRFAPKAFASLRDIFTLRHIYCHQLVGPAHVPLRKLRYSIPWAWMLLAGTEQVICNLSSTQDAQPGAAANSHPR